MKLKLGSAVLCWLVAALLPHAMWQLAWPVLAISLLINATFVAVRWIMTQPRFSLAKLWVDGYPVIGGSLILKGLLQAIGWRDLAPLIVTAILHFLILLASLRAQSLANLKHHARTSNIARLARSELQALRYVVSPPRYQARPNCKAFFLGADVAQMAWMFVLIGMVESLALHTLATSIGGKVTLMVAVLADVFIIYSVGIARSVRLIPVEVEGEQVRVRVGILFDGAIEIENITISEPFPADRSRKSGCMNGALLSAPNIYIQLRYPVDITVFTLFKKRVDRIKLKLAEPSAFAMAVSHAAAFPRSANLDEVVSAPNCLSVARTFGATRGVD